MIIEILRVIIGTILVFFIPGFVWSYLLLEQEKESEDSSHTKFFNVVERIAVSIVLSLVLVPLTTFLLNLVIDVGPSILDTIMIISLPTAIGILLLVLKRKGFLEKILKKLKGKP